MGKYLEAKINYDNYDKNVIRTVEAHTEGEYCRVALDCPELPGKTMIEKKHYLEEHYDFASQSIRKLTSAYSSWTAAAI